MNPHRLGWGFAFDFPFAQIVAIVTLLAMLSSKEAKKIPWTRENIVLLIFVFWMFITTLAGLNVWEKWQQWDKVWKIMLFTFLITMLMGTEERLKALVWVIIVSIGFYGVKGGIFTLTTGGGHQVLGPPGTFIGDRGGIGLALTMVIPLLRYGQSYAPQRWMRYALGVSMLLSAFAAIGTQGRGPLLGMAAMTLFLILKTRRKFIYTLLVAVTAFSIYSFMPPQWHERMHTIETYEQDASAMGRINAWWFAYNLARDRVLGGGFEVFRAPFFRIYAPNPGDVHDAHSIYFEILGEHGFIGLGLWLTLGIMAWFTGSWIIKHARGDPETKWMADLASMIQVSFVGYAAGGSFLGIAYFDMYYTLIAILILCKVLLRERLVQMRL
jgi:probable O-glycosylation ligase (exosortase A-associated)